MSESRLFSLTQTMHLRYGWLTAWNGVPSPPFFQELLVHRGDLHPCCKKSLRNGSQETRPWRSHLTALCLSFLTCKMERSDQMMFEVLSNSKSRKRKSRVGIRLVRQWTPFSYLITTTPKWSSCLTDEEPETQRGHVPSSVATNSDGRACPQDSNPSVMPSPQVLFTKAQLSPTPPTCFV